MLLGYGNPKRVFPRILDLVARLGEDRSCIPLEGQAPLMW